MGRPAEGQIEVAAVQFGAGPDVQANLKVMGELVHAAARRSARLVVAPEFAMFGALDHPDDVAEVAESLSGGYVSGVASLAREAGVTLVAGMLERDPGGDPRPFNTVVALGPDGRLLGSYRKLHLYDAFGFHESELFQAGSHGELLTFPTGELTCGVMTCYDLRFPEIARALVDEGADLLVVPAAWVAGPAKEDHWLTLLRARAIENTCYVVAAGQTGRRCVAQSVVVDPMGTVIAGAGEAPGVALATAGLERITSVRQLVPSLEHRRFRVSRA